MTTPSRQRTILVVIDFSLSSNHAASRAAQVAREHGAALALLHVLQPQGEGSMRDAPLAAARTQLERLGQRLQKHFGVEVSVHATRGDPLRKVVEAARDVQLLVIGSRGRNTLAEFLLGTPAERIIRMARVPALVVKREVSGSCQNILAPVALSQEAQALVSAALEFSPDADVEVFHVLCLRHETALPKQECMLPDLMVVGKRHQSLLADFLLGSVTRRLLSHGRADALVLPVVDARQPGGSGKGA